MPRCCTPARCCSGRERPGRRSARVPRLGSGHRNDDHPDVRRDLFCSGHAFLPDGRLCVPGGAPAGVLRSTHLFDRDETWTKVADMAQARWYPTVLTLPTGGSWRLRGAALPRSRSTTPARTRQTVAGATRTFSELTVAQPAALGPDLLLAHRLGAGDMVQTQTAYLTLTGPLSRRLDEPGTAAVPRSPGGMAAMIVDDTVSPPATQVIVVGGGAAGRRPHATRRAPRRST